MNDFLTKPFEPTALLRLLARWLDGTASPVPALAPRPALGRVDFALGLTQCLGRPALYERVLRRFAELSETPPQRIAAALARGDAVVAALQAHSLISTAATIGAQALSDLAREFETALREGESGRWPALAERLAAEHAQVARAVAEYLQRVDAGA